MSTTPEATQVAIDAKTVFSPALHHVNLKTTQLDAMIAWYSLVAGVRVNFQGPLGAFLTNDAANHLIALTALPGLRPDQDRVIHDGMHHTAFEYASLDELLGSYVGLAARGIEPHACVDHGLTTSFYYLDPDGNSVEMQADNHGDWKQSTAFLRDDPRFAADPIGKLVDPELLLERRRQRVGPHEIHEGAYRGDFPPSGPIDMRLPMPPA